MTAKGQPSRWRRASRRRRAAGFDEFGGAPDGGVAIIVNDTVVHRTPRSVASSLRYFVARTESPGVDQLPHLLAVLAATPREGVTFVSRSLAAVLAYDTQHSVALVDLNWRLPSDPTTDAARRRLGSGRRHKVAPQTIAEISGKETLADAVEREAAVSNIVVPTVNPRLTLVDAGPISPPRRPAVAASAALDEVVTKLTNDYDHVVFDVPAVLASSDALRLAQLADAYVMVVRQGRTTTGQLDAALDELRGLESLGVILNRTSSKVPKSIRRLLGA